MFIEFPILPLDIYLKETYHIFSNESFQNKYIYTIRNEFLELWKNYFVIRFLNSQNDFIECCKRMLLFNFVKSEYGNSKIIAPCFFIGKNENEQFFCVEEKIVNNTTIDKIEFLKTYKFLKNECNFVYGGTSFNFNENNKLINFLESSFYLNGEFIGNKTSETFNIFFQLFESQNFLDVQILNYYESLLYLRVNLGLFHEPIDDYINIFQFLKSFEINNLEKISKKYNLYVVNNFDEKLFNNLLKIKNGIERINKLYPD